MLRPGGRVIVKESQTLSALFLPGHPDLERRIQAAERSASRDEAGERSFQERRQRTLESLLRGRPRRLLAARPTCSPGARRCRPPRATTSRSVVFGRNWGERLRPLLTADDWRRRTALCEPNSPDYILARPDYYCLYPITVFTARTRA